jgi:enamine deaminase RidA (YjgF/YER057c/UK114 family)
VKHSERLAELGLTLPNVAPPLAAYIPAVRSGDLVFTAGQLPFVDGKLPVIGHLGVDVEVEIGKDLARQCALNGLAAVAAILDGGIDDIVRVVKVVGFVASAPDFTGQPAVVNGASELLGEVLGDAGIHARSAVGVAVLPLGAPVEVELVCQVR